MRKRKKEWRCWPHQTGAGYSTSLRTNSSKEKGKTPAKQKVESTSGAGYSVLPRANGSSKKKGMKNRKEEMKVRPDAAAKHVYMVTNTHRPAFQK